MAESDNTVRLVTGRQSAHMEIIRRHPNGKASDEDRRKPREMPEVSVVEWEVHEEVCEPYRIKALVSTSGPVSRKDVLGQWVKFRFQTEEGAPVRAFFGFVSRFHSVSRSPDGCTYRVVIRQRLALADGPSNCATYQNKSSAEIIEEVIGRNDLKPWTRVVTRLRRQHPDANVEAHECGHYFNFPDEYYDQGGWLHETYIKNEQIDFSLLDAKAGTLFWQGHSANTAFDSNGWGYGGNLMGDGANGPVQQGRITASIKPYYLEYVRRQFSLATNKLWRIGYDA